MNASGEKILRKQQLTPTARVPRRPTCRYITALGMNPHTPWLFTCASLPLCLTAFACLRSRYRNSVRIHRNGRYRDPWRKWTGSSVKIASSPAAPSSSPSTPVSQSSAVASDASLSSTSLTATCVSYVRFIQSYCSPLLRQSLSVYDSFCRRELVALALKRRSLAWPAAWKMRVSPHS
jgi:hypothetical protein